LLKFVNCVKIASGCCLPIHFEASKNGHDMCNVTQAAKVCVHERRHRGVI
jgi:hypothetical protein